MYKHTQVGHRAIGILLGTGALTAGLLVARTGPVLVLGIVLVALLTAAFLFGSLTQNAFDARRSDVDCVAVIRRGLSPVVVSRLRANLGRLSGRHSWMRRLQLTILIQRELLRFNGDGWPGPVRGVGGRPTGAMPPSRRAAFYTHCRRGGRPPSARR